MDDPRRTDPPRLTSGAADLGRRERAAGALLRHVVRGNPVSLREIARVRDRLRGRERARTPTRRRASAAAIVILVLGTIGLGAGAASRLSAVQSWARRHLGAAVVATNDESRGVHHAEPPPPAMAPPPPSDAPRVPPAVAAPPVTQRPPQAGTGVKHQADRKTPPSGFAEELALFERATRLRQRPQDVELAIAALREYRRRFPDGLLRNEADLALVRALLAAGRPEEALAVLDEIPTQPGLRGRELAVLRGELRARAGRCVEALEDFDVVMAAGTGDAAETRASAGRAQCLKDLARSKH